MKPKKRLLPLAAAAGLALSITPSVAEVVLQDGFSGTIVAGPGAFDGRTPDTTNAAGNTYTEQANNAGGGFGQLELDASGLGGTQGAKTGFNNAAHIQYSNSGTPNTEITLSIELQLNDLADDAAIRGIGLGFFDLAGISLYPPDLEASSTTGFTGIVVNPGGDLEYVLEGASELVVDNPTTVAGSSWLGLSYSVDPTTGTFTNVTYGGQDFTADFAAVTNFASTDTAGFLGSTAVSALYFGRVDNFVVDVASTSPPSITALNPDGVTGVYPGSVLVATFNENIELTGSGSITIEDTVGANDVVINVTDSAQVTVSGKDLIIAPPANLAFNTPFEVVIGNNTVQDTESTPNVYTGTTSGEWTFTTAVEETSPPVITLKSPDHEDSGVARDATIVATFDQNLLPGTGDITIKDLDDDSTTQTIAVTDASQVSIAGMVLTIDPATDLSYGKNYAVQIAAGAVKNFSDLGFAGITSGWDFTAVSLPPAFEINNFADGTDAATGISTATTYTHLVDINKDADTADINGVIFDNTLATYTLTGPSNNFAGNGNNGADPGSGMEDLLDNFRFGGSSHTLTVSGLTPGTTYKLRLYVSHWNGTNVSFSFDDTAPATVVTGVNRGAGQTIPSSFDHTYTLGAGDTDLAVTITADDGSNNMHWYGFSNEVVGGGSDTFAGWISDPAFGLDAGDQDFDDDPDGDRLSNGIEGFFGTSPAVANAGLAQVSKSGNLISFEHPEADPALSDVNGSYEWSLDLETWHPSGTVGDITVTISPSKNDPETGVTTVTADTTGSTTPPARLFLRAVATQG